MLAKVLQGCQWKQKADREELLQFLPQWDKHSGHISDALPLLSGLFSLQKRFNTVCVIKADQLTPEILESFDFVRQFAIDILEDVELEELQLCSL